MSTKRPEGALYGVETSTSYSQCTPKLEDWRKIMIATGGQNMVRSTAHISPEENRRALEALLEPRLPCELFWASRQSLFETRGYILRPRLRRDWTPSWRSGNVDIFEAEDALTPPYPSVCIDATRISDGKLVFMKQVPTAGEEMNIATLLSEDRSNPANHCVPILDVFQDDVNPDISYLVMPFLRDIDDPPLESVADVTHFVDQMLEGIVYMHERGIAHRDCTGTNLVMDATPLFPVGFHPVNQNCRLDLTGEAPMTSRLEAEPIRYYFIDFGISVRVPPETDPKQTVGIIGLDRDAPELSATVPYDPFKVDVFIIGNVFRTQLLTPFSNVKFLVPLASAMMHRDPDARPDAAAALRQWQALRGRFSILQHWRRLRRYDESSGLALALDVVWMLRLGMLLAKRVVRCTAYTVRAAIKFFDAKLL